MEEKLLESDFQMLPTRKELYTVRLTRQNIIYHEKLGGRNAVFTSLLLCNVIGCKVYESRASKDPYPCIKVISMVKNKKGLRSKMATIFRVIDFDDKQSNIHVAELWARTILWLLREPKISPEELQEKEENPPPLHYLVLINPKSGTGKSEKVFKDKVQPLFTDAGIRATTVVTEYAGHCKEFAGTFDHGKYDVVVICSGDGLLHEYLNGVCEREDWKAALKTPISIIPTGSGNALAASVAYASKEVYDISTLIFILLRGISKPMDIFCVETEKERRYSFLSVTWAIIADVDIESERYRALGPARFTLGFVHRLIALRQYRGLFEFLPAEQPNDDTLEEGCEATNEEGNVSPALPTNSNLVPLKQNVPPTWKAVETDFIMFMLSALSHLGADLHSAPHASFDDGRWSAQWVCGGTRKLDLVKVFTSIETGEHYDLPVVNKEDIVAFRLTPLDERVGHVAVDGENVDYGIIQGEVLPSHANIIMLNPV